MSLADGRLETTASLFERAVQVTPGGVHSPVRAFRSVGSPPLAIAEARGSRVWDADGREYIDWIGAWGPALLGHNPPGIAKAVAAQLERGTLFGLASPAEVELAERVCAQVPGCDMLRFVVSGTEAAMSAVRLARAATGRRAILKFDGCYHGHGDAFLIRAGSGAATIGVPDSPGVTEGAARDTHIARYNDLNDVDRAFREAVGGLAAVIVEPVAGNMGCIPPEPGFLEGLRTRCDAAGALLIFDEVITGFRLGAGGAQQRFGVQADLVVLGKVLGGGLPLAAYGGHRDLMQLIAPSGPVYQAGTFAAHPLSVAAGLAMMDALDQAPRARPRGRGVGSGGAGPRPARGLDVDAVPLRNTHPLLGRRWRRRSNEIRAFPPGHARGRRAAAAVAVRDRVHVRRPRRNGAGAHARCRACRVRGGELVNDRFLRACRRQPVDRAPLWIMRQAGRYLPEYRELRARVDFLTLCRTPELAVEASLQPLQRFELDAAIIFSDILTPLEALGCELSFDPSPRIARPLKTAADVEALVPRPVAEVVPYVGEAVALLRRELAGRVPVIGFCGAPFTLACYLTEGRGHEGFPAVRALRAAAPEVLTSLLDKLAVLMAEHLNLQIAAGAQAVQIFDSWAGILSPADYAAFALPAVRRVIHGLRRDGVPVIYFAPNADHLLELAATTGADVVGVCWRTPLDAARRRTGGHVALQGNLDPAALFAPPDKVRERALAVLDAAGDGPGHIMNLGHGILPETPIASVEALVAAVAERERRPA
jgi:glutamate-1-semialdehyde 2,1-aminomutase